MSRQRDKLDKTREEIKNDIDSFDIRKLIKRCSPPFEWSGIKDHPINMIGYYYFGIGDGFKFLDEAIQNADELLLWKLYGLIQNYWLVHYETWYGESK